MATSPQPQPSAPPSGGQQGQPQQQSVMGALRALDQDAARIAGQYPATQTFMRQINQILNQCAAALQQANQPPASAPPRM